MADQMNWSADGAPFSDIGSDLLNSTEFDSNAFGGVEGNFLLLQFLSRLCLYSFHIQRHKLRSV